ncbi:Putative Catalytic activity: cyclobutadipyrimidine [Aspergillus calidoustus]|uniref:Putative Catalytic activity: cyclobutadipyrimidine n=1 Tax=Aspergillus calidoustus TaxID=454130 RepID=A0A0U5GXZ7_ASPCI|nr:Putative Catalytic activity: cyclobutadipyrimidine [Aspergillus calidoustus]
MPAKRKHGDENDTSSRYHPNADQAASFGIVLREYYPPEMSNARCDAYTNGTLEKPIETLERANTETAQQRKEIAPNAAVIHWFKTDLRIHDNRALQAAYNLAREAKIPLITLYILSPEDLIAHLISPARVDLILRTLAQLQRDLSELDIPLYIETQTNRSSIPARIVDLCQEWGASNLFANIEYEVDELRREASLIRLCAENGIAFETKHDTCVVPPGSLASQTGKQYAVYTHWFRAWVTFLDRNPDVLDVGKEIGSNPGDTRRLFPSLFDCPVPEAPEGKQLDEETASRMKELYPAGEHEGQRRLEAFLEEKAKAYDEERNFVAGESTSVLSPYFTSGLLSTRTAVAQARKANGSRIAGGEVGYISWISEVAWRDFYRHVLVHWPFICMNKCFKPTYTNLDWSYNEDHFTSWATGRTGYPIVDAAMRQVNHDGWMHNRARMIVSSFLSKDLLIDWRRGERYFMEHLVDGDFASNHGGWGFGSSTGVDPQPYFRIFNPLRQSERFDPDGDYIRRWVKELRDVEGNAVHAPYERGAGAVAERNGYPQPIVKHNEARDRALKRYKEASGGGK